MGKYTGTVSEVASHLSSLSAVLFALDFPRRENFESGWGGGPVLPW